MSKLPDCPLRTIRTEFGKNKQLVCSGGMNFFSLGEDASLCHHCVLKAGAEILHCPHSDIYTTMRTLRDSQLIIGYDVECYASKEHERCKQCPKRRNVNG
jgi:hypothetical protein